MSSKLIDQVLELPIADIIVFFSLPTRSLNLGCHYRIFKMKRNTHVTNAYIYFNFHLHKYYLSSAVKKCHFNNWNKILTVFPPFCFSANLFSREYGDLFLSFSVFMSSSQIQLCNVTSGFVHRYWYFHILCIFSYYCGFNILFSLFGSIRYIYS